MDARRQLFAEIPFALLTGQVLTVVRAETAIGGQQSLWLRLGPPLPGALQHLAGADGQVTIILLVDRVYAVRQPPPTEPRPAGEQAW